MWARETWGLHQHQFDHECRDVVYQADEQRPAVGRWRPSIHMPRWAARIERDIVRLRFERLHDISEADALAEGVDPGGPVGYIPASDRMGRCRYQFAILWDEIHGIGSWDENPLLLVYEFAEMKSCRPQ